MDGFAELDVADDVFEHHDRIVDDEAHGEREGEQREVVDAVAAEMHHDERAEDRDRHGDARDDRGGEGAEEEEDYQHHENDREDEGELHLGDGLADRARAVDDDVQVDGGGQLLAERGQERLHGVDDLDGIGARLAAHLEIDRAVAVEPAGGFVALHAVDDLAEISEADGGAVAVGDDDAAEGLGVAQLAGGLERDGLVAAVEGAGGEVDVAGGEGGADLVDTDATGGEGARIEKDADGVFLGAGDLDLGDAVDAGDALGE